MNALNLLRTVLAAAEPPAIRDKRYLVHVYAIANSRDLQRALPISIPGVKQPDVRDLDRDPDVPNAATVNFDIYVDAASPLELAQKIALFLLRTQAALREPALFGAGYAGCGARTKQEITDLAKRLARRAVARGVAQAAVETPAIKRSVLVCVFRGSNHKEHAGAFSSDLAAAGVATRPDHGNPADRYSEVHVNVRGPKSEITTTLRTTLRLLRKHHGLFVRYRRSSTGLQDFECAPSDFEPADYKYMLEHGDQNVTGAAEPRTPGSYEVFFDVSLRSEHKEFDRLLAKATQHVQIYGDDIDSGSATTDIVRITLVGNKPNVRAVLTQLLAKAWLLPCVLGFRVDHIYPWLDKDEITAVQFAARVARERHATAAAEPQPAASKNFDFYFWERGKWSSYPVEAVRAVTAIVDSIGASIDKPSVSIKLASGVDDARRIHVRIVTNDLRSTLHALITELPKYRDFVAFCNNDDADDSFILPSDRQGVAELVRTLAREWRS